MKQRPRAGWRVLAPLLPIVLGACSPALDWREASLSAHVKLLMPCKPERLERGLKLDHGEAQALMLVCDADGLTWSASRYELGQADRVALTVTELRHRLSLNLGGAEAPWPAPLAAAVGTAGSPALAAGVRSQLEGRRPGGEGVLAQALFFGEATRAYQLVVMAPVAAAGAAAPASAEPLRRQAALATFFEGVQVSR